MIWFSCKKCSKVHGRPDNSAGTMIFCACGHGNTVPWESSAAEPVGPPPVATMAPPNVPDLAPIQFDPVKVNGPVSSSPGKEETYPLNRYNQDEEERTYRRSRLEKRDPDFCFNHQRRPKVERCAECGEGFCQDCLVKFQGVLLCGPCKNFRARRQELPPATSAMASASLIIALLAGPLTMCLLLGPSSSNSPTMQMFSYMMLMPQAIALALGLWALRDAQKENKGGGQWVACTGIAAALMTTLMTLLVNIVVSRYV